MIGVRFWVKREEYGNLEKEYIVRYSAWTLRRTTEEVYKVQHGNHEYIRYSTGTMSILGTVRGL